MIEQYDDTTYDLQCDHCLKTETITAATWQGMIAESKKRGWTHKKRVKGDWLNLCQRCSGRSE